MATPTGSTPPTAVQGTLSCVQKLYSHVIENPYSQVASTAFFKYLENSDFEEKEAELVNNFLKQRQNQEPHLLVLRLATLASSFFQSIHFPDRPRLDYDEFSTLINLPGIKLEESSCYLSAYALTKLFTLPFPVGSDTATILSLFGYLRERPNDPVASDALFLSLKEHPQGREHIKYTSLLLSELPTKVNDAPSARLARLASAYFDATHFQKNPTLTLSDLANMIPPSPHNTDFLSPFALQQLLSMSFKPEPLFPRPVNCRDTGFFYERTSTVETLRNRQVLMLTAVSLGDYPSVRKLRTLGVPLESLPPPRCLCSCESYDPDLPSPILTATALSDSEMIRFLHEQGAAVDSLCNLADEGEPPEFITPLAYAAKKRRPKEVYATLLELGASPNSYTFLYRGQEVHTCSPLFEAIASDQLEMLKDLLVTLPESQRNVTNERGYNLAQEAALLGKTAALETLKGIIDLSNFIDCKPSPLALASKSGHYGTVEYLAGVFPELLEKKDSLGRTPAVIAVLNGNADVLRVLQRAKANLQVRFAGRRLTELFDPCKHPALARFFEEKGL